MMREENREENDLLILAESPNGYVSECPCCHEFNVTYKNFLLVFDAGAMLNFFAWIMANRSSLENYQPLPHGRCRIYSGPHNNLFLVFDDEELDELADLFAAVKLVLEARQIVSTPRNV